MKRRSFLKMLGMGAAASIFLPFEQSLFAAANGNKRYVIFVEGNGIEPLNFLSTKTETALTNAGANLGNTRLLYTKYQHDSPLEIPDADLSSALSLGDLAAGNIESKSSVVLGLSSTITGGGHSTEAGALSCTRSAVGSPSGITIDEHLSLMEKVNCGSPFQTLRLGVVGGNKKLNYSTCAFGARNPAPILTDPTAAFNALFSSVSSAAGSGAFQERNQLLDFAVADANRALGLFKGSAREQAKLETYLSSLETMVRRQDKILELGPKLTQVKPAEPNETSLYTSAAPLERLQSQVDLATSALLGGLTNVVVIALGTGSKNFALTYESLAALYPGGDMFGGHDVRHFASNGNQGYVDLLTAITKSQVGMMAQMARTLDGTPEAGGEGTMLDNTVMLYMSDNGEKHHSLAEEWPVLMIGGKNLGFANDGRCVVYPREGNANNRQVSNLFNSLCHSAGDPLDEFGKEGARRIAKGPLSELWS